METFIQDGAELKEILLPSSILDSTNENDLELKRFLNAFWRKEIEVQIVDSEMKEIDRRIITGRPDIKNEISGEIAKNYDYLQDELHQILGKYKNSNRILYEMHNY